jgi:hypothetical protein
MQNFIVILIIIAILYGAVRPIIKFKKEKGSCYSCYGCAHNKNGSCNINKKQIEAIKLEIMGKK